MSADNVHMNNKVKGVRVTMYVATYMEAFLGVTWENIEERFSGCQMHGHTKYSDAAIMAFWFKSLFVRYRAGQLVGYRGTQGAISNAMTFRLKRMNVENSLELYEALVNNGLLPEGHIAKALKMDIGREYSALPRSIYKSSIFKYYCKRLVMEALSEAVPKGQHPDGKTKVRQAAERLCVPLRTIRYWRDKRVKDIMVRPGR